MKIKYSILALALYSVLGCYSAFASTNDLGLDPKNSVSVQKQTPKTSEEINAELSKLQQQSVVNSATVPNSSATSSQKTVSMEKLVLSTAEPPKLTEMQKKTLTQLNSYKKAKVNNTVFVNKDNVVFTYGTQTANIITSVLTVTDIELEPGEVVNSVNLGDMSRWNVEPAVTGSGDSQTQHVLVKPLDIGLKTNLLIATDRRGYRIELTSTADQYYPHVSFSYPEKLLAAFQAQRMIEQKQKEKESITVVKDDGSRSKTYLGDLNFNYKVEGSVSWKPVRVYDDGRKTIIELPKKVEYAKAPALMLLSKKGGVFSDEKTDIINYRLQDNRYVVDGIFETAILTMGLDSQQQRVVITRGN